MRTLPLLALLLLAFLTRLGAAEPTLPLIARSLVSQNEGFWRSCAHPPDGLGSRTLFAYALVLSEARQHPERLERLFELAAQMQDREPASRGYGNFRWYWRDDKVLDYNAVDFCMRGGSLLWLKHREFIPVAARERLRPILSLAAQGCLKHKVPESYSNIALMNAGDLILLGEALGDVAVADEGYARLGRFYDYTKRAGVHEFDSPTYTGVDLDGLVMIEAFCQRQAGRDQARALLELFWTDIALNWFPPAQKLAGAHSRTYDFLRGLGYLDVQLTLNGWLDGPMPKDVDAIYGAQAMWHPPAQLHERARQFPRLVRQRWGLEAWQTRTHYLQPDITLSSIASSYGGRMDMPLTVDLPGSRDSVRCYFIADGRDDAYGKRKVPAGAHQKTFHLDPFWTAVQRDTDALGLVIYRAKDIPTNATTLTSTFVLPLAAMEFRVGEKRVSFAEDKPVRTPVKPDEVVALRRGTAAVAIRVPWSRDLDERGAAAALVFDGNAFGAVRLVVEHGVPGEARGAGRAPAGAVFRVSIGSGLKTDAAFDRWLGRAATASAIVEALDDHISVHAAGEQGQLFLRAAAPWSQPAGLEPPASRAVLDCGAEDLGRAILRF